MATNTVETNTKSSWHRWFRRTNVYIAEYILMLVLVGLLTGVLASLWYSFFNLLLDDGYSGRTLAMTTAGQVGALVVIAPAAYWFYARVTGQEMVQPEVYKRKSRTVFLTIWLFVSVVAVVGLAMSVVGTFVMGLFGFNDTSNWFVASVLPGVLAALTLLAGIWVVAKRVSRKFVMTTGIVLPVVSLIMIVACLVTVAVRNNSSQPSKAKCDYSAYANSQCSYDEFMQSQQQPTPRSYTTPFY